MLANISTLSNECLSEGIKHRSDRFQQALGDVLNPRHNGANDAGFVSEDASPLTALGSCLREAREERGLSITELAGKLRMGEEQLLALESGDPQRLPEVVFVIAQARRIATALGVEINPLVEPLKQESANIKPLPSPLSSAPANNRERGRTQITAQSYTTTSSSRRRSGNTPVAWIGSLALVAGLAVAGVWGWQRAPQLVGRLLPKATKPKTTTPPPAPAKVRPPAPATNLTINAVQPSWLAVRTAKGNVLFEGTFKGSRKFPLAGGLELLSGRPDLVQVSQGDQPAKPLGRIDQIRWVSFSPPPR